MSLQRVLVPSFSVQNADHRDLLLICDLLVQGLAELKMKLAGIAMQLETDYPTPREHGDEDGMMFPDGQGGGQGMMDPQQQQQQMNDMAQQQMMQGGGGMGMGMGGGMMQDPYGQQQQQQQQYGGGGWA